MVRYFKQDPSIWKDLLIDITMALETLTPDKILNSGVENMPWLNYSDILDQLKELILEVEESGPPRPRVLEQTMIDWLQVVAPDKVNDRNLNAIKFFACGIGDKIDNLRFKPIELTDIHRLNQMPSLPIQELTKSVYNYPVINSSHGKVRSAVYTNLKTTHVPMLLSQNLPTVIEYTQAEEPRGNKSNTKQPQTKVSVTQRPQTKVSETQRPQSKISETNRPQTKISQTNRPQSKVSETKQPYPQKKRRSSIVEAIQILGELHSSQTHILGRPV